MGLLDRSKPLYIAADDWNASDTTPRETPTLASFNCCLFNAVVIFQYFFVCKSF